MISVRTEMDLQANYIQKLICLDKLKPKETFDHNISIYFIIPEYRSNNMQSTIYVTQNPQ